MFWICRPMLIWIMMLVNQTAVCSCKIKSVSTYLLTIAMGSNVKISNDGAPKLWRKTHFRTRRRSMNVGGHPAHTVELARNSWLLFWCQWDIKCVPRLGLRVVHSQMVQTVTRSDSLTLFIQIIYIAPLEGDHLEPSPVQPSVWWEEQFLW